MNICTPNTYAFIVIEGAEVNVIVKRANVNNATVDMDAEFPNIGRAYAWLDRVGIPEVAVYKDDTTELRYTSTGDMVN